MVDQYRLISNICSWNDLERVHLGPQGRTKLTARLTELLDNDQATDLALRYVTGAHRLDQVSDRTSRVAMPIGLLNHRRQGLLGGAAQLQKIWK